MLKELWKRLSGQQAKENAEKLREAEQAVKEIKAIAAIRAQHCRQLQVELVGIEKRIKKSEASAIGKMAVHSVTLENSQDHASPLLARRKVTPLRIRT